MSLESLAADLEKNGIGFRVVAAQEAVDTGAPYSRKRFLKSLDAKRLTYVGVALSQLNTLAENIEAFGKEAADLDSKKLGKHTKALRSRIVTLEDAFEQIDNIGLQAVTSYSGILRRVYNHIIKLEEQRWSGAHEDWYMATETLLIWRMVIVKELKKVLAEAKTRNSKLVDEIQKLAKTGKLSATNYSVSLR